MATSVKNSSINKTGYTGPIEHVKRVLARAGIDTSGTPDVLIKRAKDNDLQLPKTENVLTKSSGESLNDKKDDISSEDDSEKANDSDEITIKNSKKDDIKTDSVKLPDSEQSSVKETTSKNTKKETPDKNTKTETPDKNTKTETPDKNTKKETPVKNTKKETPVKNTKKAAIKKETPVVDTKPEAPTKKEMVDKKKNTKLDDSEENDEDSPNIKNTIEEVEEEDSSEEKDDIRTAVKDEESSLTSSEEDKTKPVVPKKPGKKVPTPKVPRLVRGMSTVLLQDNKVLGVYGANTHLTKAIDKFFPGCTIQDIKDGKKKGVSLHIIKTNAY